MDYAEQADVQMPGSYIGASKQRSTAPQPPRSFGELQGIVGRLRTTRQQLDDMLDRVSPQPTEINEAKLGISGGPQPYLACIGDINNELDRIGSLIDQLGRHV